MVLVFLRRRLLQDVYKRQPHRGCEFADYLLNKIPESVKQKIADGYNAALKKLGDLKPDFLAAVEDLTAAACRKLNEEAVSYTHLITIHRLQPARKLQL